MARAQIALSVLLGVAGRGGGGYVPLPVHPLGLPCNAKPASGSPLHRSASEEQFYFDQFYFDHRSPP